MVKFLVVIGSFLETYRIFVDCFGWKYLETRELDQISGHKFTAICIFQKYVGTWVKQVKSTQFLPHGLLEWRRWRKRKWEISFFHLRVRIFVLRDEFLYFSIDSKEDKKIDTWNCKQIKRMSRCLSSTIFKYQLSNDVDERRTNDKQIKIGIAAVHLSTFMMIQSQLFSNYIAVPIHKYPTWLLSRVIKNQNMMLSVGGC